MTTRLASPWTAWATLMLRAKPLRPTSPPHRAPSRLPSRGDPMPSSINFPTTPGAFQTVFAGGGADGFVAKITNVVLPPPPTVGKVTGGGTINVTGGIGNFGFIVQRQAADQSIQGDLQYVNHSN